MSYLVLARKYRPQTFDEIVGQEHVTRTLANAFEKDRVHHAFLFCGPRGVGKTTAARVLGKALNCEKGPTASPCGECGACTSITDGSSVDYYEMDGASNRGIDSIRELTEAVRYQPAVLRKKVYVIDEVHMLTTEAFNALLKTLEEPPPHVTFVMATTEPHKVPNTILSRCQRYDFKLVPGKRLAEFLGGIFEAEKLSVQPGALSVIVRESGGSVRDALSLSDQIISYVGDEQIAEALVAEVLGVASRSLTRTLVTALAGGDAASALTAAEQATSRGIDELQVARAIVRYLRDLAVLQASSGDARLVDAADDEVAELVAESKAIESWRVRQMFDRMIKACDDLGQSQQPKLILDLALIEVAAQEPVVPIGDLLERLTDLESRLGKPARRPAARPPVAEARIPAPVPAPVVTQTAAPVMQKSSAPPDDLPPIPPAASPSFKTPPSGAPRDRQQSSLAPVRAEEAPSADPQRAPAAEVPAIGSSPSPTVEAKPASVQQPAPAAPKPTVTSPIERWERLLTTLEKANNLAMVGLYQQAKVMTYDSKTVEVGFPVDSVTADLAASEEKRVAIEELLTKLEGRPIKFSVKLLSDAELSTHNAKSVIEASAERAESERDRRHKEAESHPMIRTAVDKFEASIKEIKTDV